MALGDLIPSDEGRNDNREIEVHSDDDDESAWHRVQRRMFLKEYNEDGNLIPDPKNKRKVPETFKRGWIDITDDVKIGTVKKTQYYVHYAFCACSSKIIFWTRGPWYRCYDCNRVLINTDWKENWWKDNSGQSGLDQFV